MKKFILLSLVIFSGYFSYSQKHIDSVLVTPASVCAGGNVSISIYGSGYIPVDSVYAFLSATGGASYNQSTPILRAVFLLNPITYNYPLPANTAPGTYRIYAKDTITGNQIDTFSGTFTVNLPATSNAGSNTTICSGTAYTLTGASVGGSASTGAWSITGVTGSMTNAASQLSSTSQTASPSSVTFTPISPNFGTATLTLTTDDPTGPCGAATSTVVLTVNQPAGANAGSAATICSGSAYALTGSSVSGAAASGTWSITGVTGSMTNAASQLSNTGATATPSSVTFTPISPNFGTVTLTLTTDDPSGPCNAATSNVVLTINQPAIANAGSPATICSGIAYALTGSSVSGTASTGAWSITGATGSMTTNSSQLSSTGQTATPSSVTFTPIATNFGTVTLTLTTDNPSGPCNAVTSTVTLTVNQPATADAGSNATICSGTAHTLTGASIGGSATTGTWAITSATGTLTTASSQLSNTNPTSSPASVIFTPIGLNTGTVTITLTTDDPAGPCGVATNDVVITVNAGASSNAGSPATICSGSAYMLTGASIGGSASTGTWSITAVTGTMTNASSQLSNTGATATPALVTFTPIATNSGTVTLTLTTDNPPGPCGPATSNVVLTVNLAPTANAGSPATICSGVPYNLAGSSLGGGAVNGTWSITNVTGTMTNAASQISNTGAVTNPSTVSFTPISPNSGTVTLTLTTNAAAPCNAVSSSVVLTVNPPATADAGTPQSVCQGGTVSLSGSRGGSATGSTWSAPSGSFSNASSLTSNYTPSITSGNVTLTLTTSGPCAAAISTVLITVNPTATADAGPLLAPICQGGTSASLGGSVGGSATGGTWSDGGVGGTFNPNATTLNATWTPPPAYNGIATLTLTASGGSCGTPTASKPEIVNPNASLILTTANDTQTVCLGNPIKDIVYTIGGGGTGTTATGLPAGVTGTLVGTVFTIKGTPTVSGAFPFTVTTTGSCAQTNANGLITVNPMPAQPTALSSNPSHICLNQVGVNFGVDTVAGLKYIWSTNNSSVIIHGKFTPSALFDFPSSGTSFDIFVTAINATGCRDSLKITIPASGTITNPPSLILTNNNKTLVCLDNTQVTYQWGYDDVGTFKSNDIAGATLQDYTPAGGFDFTKRNYYVRVNSGGCSYKVYYNPPLAIGNNGKGWNYSLRPNPNSGSFDLTIEGDDVPEYSFISDVVGREIMELSLQQGSNNVNLESLPGGIYYLQIRTASGSQSLKFVITK